MKISELKAGMNNISLRAKVVKVSEPRQVITKFGTQTTLVTAVLGDESGSIQMTLWGKQSEGIKEGSEVEISSAFTKEFRGELQIGLGRGGSIKVVN